MKTLALYPATAGETVASRIYMRNMGERLVYRGGYWYRASHAGVFNFYANNTRAYAGNFIGFRSAFVEL